MKKKLRSGYTTGACAAAAAKAATMLLLQSAEHRTQTPHPSLPLKGEGKGGGERLDSGFCALSSEVEIPFPDGSRHKFRIQDSGYRIQDKTAFASVIKDAGDDPDITNGAEIVAEVFSLVDTEKGGSGEKEILQYNNHFPPIHPFTHSPILKIKGGKGVGVVTKPGLSVPVGGAAINPVPRKIIKEAVMEAIWESKEQRAKNKDSNIMDFENERGLCSLVFAPGSKLEITISVPEGERLAKKTLNSRLGIMGGISILGTTGIVKPISTEAWTATITASMNVAKAMNYDEIVLSAGRTSERAHMKRYNLSEECYVMMGDYLEFSLLEAKRHGFGKIHLCAQWGKMLKIAMTTPQTHVRHGAIDIKKAVGFLEKLGQGLWGIGHEFNTAREIFDFINSSPITHYPSIFSKVCNAAKRYAEKIADRIPVISYLVSYEGEIIASSE